MTEQARSISSPIQRSMAFLRICSACLPGILLRYRERATCRAARSMLKSSLDGGGGLRLMARSIVIGGKSTWEGGAGCSRSGRLSRTHPGPTGHGIGWVQG